MRLGDIAHVRSGDKGDTAQLSVIAFDPEHFPLLARAVTVDRLLNHFGLLRAATVQRYELPRLGALNFVLTGALGGGVTRSLALDAHGKSLGMQLLDMPVEDDTNDEVRA